MSIISRLGYTYLQMAGICVSVDNGHLQPLLAGEEGSRGALPLTTLASGQSRARIDVLWETGGHLYTFIIANITTDKPAIDVRGWLRGNTLHLEFDLEGITCHRATVQLKKTRRWWVLAPAAMIAAALILLIVPIDWAGTGVVEEPAAAPPAASQPSPDPGSSTPASSEKPADQAVQALDAPPEQSEGPSPEQPSEQPLEQPRGQSSDQSSGSGQTPVITDGQEPPEPVELSLTVYFEPNVASISLETSRLLQDFLPELSRYPVWTIEGHCALAGTEVGRKELSLERAVAVYEFLTSSGWRPEEQQEIAGLGGTVPVTLDTDLQDLNRRVEIRNKLE